MLNLYPHQQKAVDALSSFFAEKLDGSPLIVAPVGSGKSLLIAEFIRRACTQYTGTKILVLTHVTELLTQNADHLIAQYPECNYSFYAAKLGKKSFSGDVIFASINSIYKKAYKIPKTIDLIIVDEAHLISPDDTTMYQTFIRDMKLINPYLKVIGFTGTNFRATDGRLTEGDNRIFTDVAYQIPMLYLIEKGFLAPLVTPAVRFKMDTRGVGTRNGDYIESQLQQRVDQDFITKACVDEIIEHGSARKKWLIFTAGIDHCKHVMEEIRSRGISCEMVIGSTPTSERNKIINNFKNGDLRCVVNVGVMTTGFNNPAIDLMAFMRPTRSRVLYVQMGGRGMRTSPGKTDCCLLDFGGVISELGPIDLVDAVKAGSGRDGEAPIKMCPEGHVCFASASVCHDCGYEFPEKELAVHHGASTAPVMSNQVEPEWHDVISVVYRQACKEGKTPYMAVIYNTLDGMFRDFVCYKHTGFAREKAVKWHRARTDADIPQDIPDALKIKFKEPKRILTRKVGKYAEVIGYDFD